jgi:hypothetical protein
LVDTLRRRKNAFGVKNDAYKNKVCRFKAVFYNNATRWRDLIRSNITEIADAHNIDLTNLKWYASFHNTTHHPHIHLMVYANDASQGWTTKRSIDDMRSMFGTFMARLKRKLLKKCISVWKNTEGLSLPKKVI